MAAKTLTRRGDLTQGAIITKIIAYTIPLLLGDLLQQFYTITDSIIVGNFVGKEGLAAVGATTAIVNTLVGFFNGVSVGATVVISQHFGAREDDKLNRAIHTTVLTTLLFGILFSFLGVFITPYMLDLMSTPADVYQLAHTYLTTYFSGLTGLMLYNMLSGILRAMGDSRRPLYFLILCASLNILLDCWFVIGLDWGVKGAAIATIIAQFVSAGALLVLMSTTRERWRLRLSQLRIDPAIFKRIIGIGLPMGLQRAITSLSNVVVASHVNVFGSSAMAGWSAHMKLFGVILLPIQTLAMATTSFVGQNYGAKKYSRIRKGTLYTNMLGLGCAICIGTITILMRQQAIGMFNSDPSVLEFGTAFIIVQTPLMGFASLCNIFGGSLRGMGVSKQPTAITLFSYVLFRQAYLFVASRIWNNIHIVAFAFPAGWIMCGVVTTGYYLYKVRRILPKDLQDGDPLPA